MNRATVHSAGPVKRCRPAMALLLIAVLLDATAGAPGAAAAQEESPAEAAPLSLDADSREAWFAVFAPDGKTLVTGGNGGIVKFWDVASRKPRRATEAAATPLRCAAYSPDGKVLATGHVTGTLTLWDTAGGTTLKSFTQAHSDGIRTVVFSPDGKLLVTAGLDRKVVVWETASWTVVRSLADLPQQALAASISPDGKVLAVALGVSVGSGNPGAVRLYDLGTLDFLRELINLKLSTLSVAFAPDGKTVATGRGRAIKLWDPTTGKPETTIEVPHVVRGFAFAPDGKQLVSFGNEPASVGTGGPAPGIAVIWDLNTGHARATIKGQGNLVVGASFSPDSRLMATAAVAASDVLVWEIAKLSTQAAVIVKSAKPQPNRPAGSVSAADPAAPFVEVPSRAGQASADSVTLALAYSPDGKWLAQAGEDKAITLRDAATGQVLKTLTGHTDIIAGLAFSADSRTLASASYDRTARLWDVAGGSEKCVLQGHKNWVLAVAFAPDGKTLATASYDKLVKLWEVTEGKEIASFAGHTASVRAVAFAPDGQTLASAGNDRMVKLWDIAGRSERATLKGHTRAIRALAYSPDGTQLASASEDSSIILWDAAKGAARATLQGHADIVNCLAFVPGGELLVSGGFDGVLKVWDVAAAKERASLRGHAEAIAALAFAPDGRRLATSGHDKVWKLWESSRPLAQVAPARTLADLGEPVWQVAFAPDSKTMIWGGRSRKVFVHQPPGGPGRAVDLGIGGVSALVFAPNGQTFAIGDRETVKIYETATMRLVSTLKGHTNIVRTLAFSPDGEVMATGSVDRSVKLWNVASGDEIPAPAVRSLPVSNVALTPDGATLVVATGDWSEPRRVGEVTLWDVATAASRGEFTGHKWGMNALLVTADGKTVVTGSGDGIRILDIATRTARATLRYSGEGSVRSLALSADGRMLASGSYKGDLVLWDFAAGRPSAVLNGHQGLIEKLAFAPDGSMLASCSYDRTLRLWSLSPARHLPPRQTVVAEQVQIRSISYAPDGTRLLVAGGAIAGASAATAVATIRDAATGKPLVTLKGHQKGINSAVFSPDGKTVATGSWDASIRFWNAATGADGLRLTAGSVTSLVFAPAGTALVSAGQDRMLKRWDVASGVLRDQVEGGPARLQCVAFSRDGAILATGGGLSTDAPETNSDVRLWTVGDRFTEVARLTGHSLSVLAAAFTPDGKSLVTGSADRSLRVWDVATRQVRVAVEGLSYGVEGLAVSPDGRWIASAGKGSNDVLLHDVQTGEERFRFTGHQALVRALAFSPDGKTLATGGDDGTLGFWDVPAPASTVTKK